MNEGAQAPHAQMTPGITGRRSLILAACMMATFMAAVESTIVATAMPTIVAELGGFHLFSWVFAAYLLAQAVTIPIYGRLADLYGRKRVFFAGAGRVPARLDAVRLRLEHGAADRVPRPPGHGRRRDPADRLRPSSATSTRRPSAAEVQGLLSGVFGVAAIVGPTLGAFLVEHVSWSLVFWVNLPIGAVAIAMLRPSCASSRAAAASDRLSRLGAADAGRSAR